MKQAVRALLDWDRRTTERLTLPLHSRWRRPAAWGAHLGDGALWFVLAGALILWGTDFVRGVACVALVAVLLATGISTAIKYTVRRRRPQELTQFYALKYDRYSFPSGHATRMGAIAVVVGYFVPWLALWGYGLAFLVALCRVTVGVHYAGDVLSGLLIGFVGAGGVVAAWGIWIC